MRIVLMDERPTSWNQFYAGQHWSKRVQMAKDKHWLIRTALDPSIQPFTEPVDITITAYFKNKPLDADNICAKLYIDGLCGRVLEDDSPKWVRSVTTSSMLTYGDCFVEIYIEPVT